MRFSVIGWNFRKTPVEVRDSLALTPEEQVDLGNHLKQRFNLDGVTILNTCNRTEIYLVNADRQLDEILNFLEDYWTRNGEGLKLRKTAYLLHDLEGVHHLFRVASSLDSMVMGEPQILGQLKDAFHRFSDAELIGKLLHRLFSRAFASAKRVRTETTIASNAVSISYAAVELAKQIFEDISQQTVMVIGAGEMAELAIRHLMKNGITKLLVTNRTFANAAKLAEQFQGLAVPFEQLERHLYEADIVISSTGARDFIITPGMVKDCLHKRRGDSMFFIDIAVPRDIDPKINDMPSAFCYDIDDLQTVVSRNQQERQKQSLIAEEIISVEVTEVELWFKSLSVVPTIRGLRKDFHATADLELDKISRKLSHLSEADSKEVEQMVHRLIHKLLHNPTSKLREVIQREDAHLYLESINELFDLHPVQVSVEEKKTKKPNLKLFKS